MKAQVIRGVLKLKRPGCACTMTRLGALTPCWRHFSMPGGVLKSREYLLRAWDEYDAAAGRSVVRASVCRNEGR